MTDQDAELSVLLETLDPSARDNLRRALTRDDADRIAIAMQLMRYRDPNGQGLGRHHRPADDVSGCVWRL
jgi:hypothetical protein